MAAELGWFDVVTDIVAKYNAISSRIWFAFHLWDETKSEWTLRSVDAKATVGQYREFVFPHHVFAGCSDTDLVADVVTPIVPCERCVVQPVGADETLGLTWEDLVEWTQ